MARLLVGVLIGVGATLAWQSHNDQAKEIVGPWAAETVMTHAPSLVWLLPDWTKPPSLDSRTPTRQVPDAAVAQPASVIRATPVPADAETSPEVAQQLAAMARDLAILRRSVNQMQAELEQKLAFPPVPPAVAIPVGQNAPMIVHPQLAPRPLAAPARPAPSALRQPRAVKRSRCRGLVALRASPACSRARRRLALPEA